MAERTRSTRQKQLIMEILRASPVPLTAGEIYARACEKQPSLAKSTVYRNLDALRERGEVTHGLLENGEGLYEAVRAEEHKHYLICKGCNAMVDLPACPLRAMEEQIAGASGFTVTDHVVQLYGYCKDCQSRRRKEAAEERAKNEER